MMTMVPNSRPAEGGGIVAQGAEPERCHLLGPEARGHGDRCDDRQEAADDDHQPAGDVPRYGHRRRASDWH